MAEDWPEIFENWADHLSNNLRLNEISILTFSQNYCKINRNQSESIVKATYGLHPTKYFEILNLIFWWRSLVTRRFGLHANSWVADEIKDFPISIDFCNRNTEMLLLFSIISPWWKRLLKNVTHSAKMRKHITTIKELWKLTKDVLRL